MLPSDVVELRWLLVVRPGVIRPGHGSASFTSLSPSIRQCRCLTVIRPWACFLSLCCSPKGLKAILLSTWWYYIRLCPSIVDKVSDCTSHCQLHVQVLLHEAGMTLLLQGTCLFSWLSNHLEIHLDPLYLHSVVTLHSGWSYSGSTVQWKVVNPTHCSLI